MLWKQGLVETSELQSAHDKDQNDGLKHGLLTVSGRLFNIWLTSDPCGTAGRSFSELVRAVSILVGLVSRSLCATGSAIFGCLRMLWVVAYMHVDRRHTTALLLTIRSK